MFPRPTALVALLPLALTGCLGFGGSGNDAVKPVTDADYNDSRSRDPNAPIFGSASILSNAKDNKNQEAGATLAVNAYLWRGALDTLSFMPLASADPFGGVIITDWYSPPAANGERFKATAYILGRLLTTEGVRVSIFRQVKDGAEWVDAPVNPATATDIENKVLARARELRSEAAASKG